MQLISKQSLLVVLLLHYYHAQWFDQLPYSHLSSLWIVMNIYISDKGPIYHHGLHELWNVAAGPQKFNNFILNFHLFFQMKIRGENHITEQERLILTCCLCAFFSLSFRFDLMLCSNLGNDNSNTGHIECSHRPHLVHGSQVTQHWSTWNMFCQIYTYFNCQVTFKFHQ